MSNKYGRLLVIDDDEDVLLAAKLLLKQYMELVHTEKESSKDTQSFEE